MHARVVTLTGATNIDAGISVLREKVMPAMRDQKGYRGFSASTDRPRGVLGVLSLWDTAAERDASWDVLAPMRAESLNATGGDTRVGNYELLLHEIGSVPPAPGSALMMMPVDMDAARVDEHLAFFRSQVLPEITAAPGFRGVRFLMNRETGRGIIGTAWSDEPAMAVAAAGAASRRRGAAARGVLFGEASFRELVLADID